MTAIDLYIAPEPFAAKVAHAQAVEGQTVAAMLTAAVNRGDISVSDLPRIRVYVDGDPLPKEETLDFVPRAGQILNVAVVPLGGGGRRGGGSKVLQTVLTIAVVVLSFYVGGGAATPGLLDSLLVRTALAATTAVVGNMAIAAAFAPKFDELASARNAYSLSGSSNAYRPRGPMPLRMGAQWVGGDIVAKPYTQTVGDDVWLKVILGWHYGPCAIGDIKIGETLLADFPQEDIQLVHHLMPGPRITTLYPNRVVQEDLSDQLDMGGAAEVHTTAPNAERVELDFAWPQGLRFNKDNGKILPQEVQLVIEQSPAGAGTWSPAPVPPTFSRTGVPMPPGNYYVQGRSVDPVRRTVDWTLPAKGQYDIRVRVFDPDGDDPDASINQTMWTAVRITEAQRPILDDYLAITEVNIRASDDLNGTLPVISALIVPYAPVWNGSSWNDAIGSWAITSNAAALVRMMVMGPAAARPLTADQMHSSWGDQYELIEERNWKGSIDLSEEMSQQDAMKLLERMGRFTSYWNGSQLVCVPDWEKEASRQVFTPRNAENYRYRRVFTEPVHAVFIEFKNYDADGRADELTVYMDGYDASNATLLESLRLDFQCTPERAYREGRVWLAKRKLQVESHEWTAGADALVSHFGSRVLMRHPTALFGAGEGRVQNRRWSGALVAGVRLDAPVTFEPGKSYALDVRRPDGVLRGVPVSGVGRTRELAFSSPLTVDQAPGAGDLVAFGEVDMITEDLEIIDIQPADGGKLQISAQRYLAVEIEAAETGPIPDLQTKLSQKPKAPRPRIVMRSGTPDGAVVGFDVAPLFGAVVSGFAVRWRRSPTATLAAGEWANLPNLGASVRQVKTPPIPEAAAIADDEEAEYRVDVQIRTVMQSGDVSEWASASAIDVSRYLTEPRNFNAEGVVVPGEDGSSYPAIRVRCDPIEAGSIQDLVVEIRKVGDPEWTSAGITLKSSNPEGEITSVAGGVLYDVRAQWRSADNYLSNWVVKPNVLVPAGGLVAAPPGGMTWQDILEALAAANGVIDRQNEQIEELRLVAESFALNAFDNARVQNLLKKLGFTAEGLPIGPVVTQQRYITADMVQSLSLIGLKTPDGSAFEIDELTFKVGGEAVATRFNVLYAGVDGAFSQITTESLARQAGDEANAEQTTALASTVGSNHSYTLGQLTTQATSIGSLTTASNLLGAVGVGGDTFVINTATAQFSPGVSVGTTLSGINTSLGANSSAIASEASARASADSTQSGQISTLQSNYGSLSATVSTQAGTIASVSGRTQAYWQTVAAAGSDPAFIRATADGYGSAIGMAATSLSLYNVSSGALVKAMELIGGVAHFGAPVNINVAGRRLIIGPAFGASADLVLWFGPASQTNGSATKTNGYFALATDGKVYYGTGELGSGGGGFSLTMSPPTAIGGRSGAGAVGSEMVTAVASGATSWRWEYVSGDVFDFGATGQFNYFSTFVSAGQSKFGVYRCFATNSSGQTAVGEVNVILADNMT